MESRGDWFLSSKGNKIYPLDLQPEDIDIEEIAHSLSLICRFGGHCREFYSVAQHCVIVTSCVSPSNKLTALLHDATECYCGDMVRPLKVQLPEYQILESNLWNRLSSHFGLPYSLPEEVEKGDARVLLAEKRDLLVSHNHVWNFPQCKFPELEPFPTHSIIPWNPTRSKLEFLRLFRDLSQGK